MATVINLKRILHRKNWEICTPSMGPNNATSGTTAGSFVASDKYNVNAKASAYFVNGPSLIYRYDAEQDGWMQIANSGIAGTYAAGACGEYRGLSAMGGVFTQTATAGGTATLTTNRTIVRNLAGSRLRVIAGTGVGFDGTIVSNTIGANAVITTSGSTVFDATTQYQVYAGSLWYFNPGTTAVGFSVYDVATNAWTARSVTNLPTAWGTAGQLVSTMGSAAVFASGTSTGTNTTTTLNNTGKAWATNQWANYQVRITSGVGAGQIRIISSNTATALTVAAAWTVTPDATSVYAIEGNDDYMYLLGNNAVTLYRFQISTNTWTVLAPTAARAANAAGGCSANWIESVSTWTLNANDSANALTVGSTLLKQNGRYIFSFRGGGSSGLDVYDIAANTWISTIAYGNANETFSAGTSSVDYAGNIYIQRDNTGRILRLELDTFSLQTFSAHAYSQGTTVEGCKMFIIPFVDGATTLPFIYTQVHSSNLLLRSMVF
jgi:hypothetical protein